MRFFNNRPLVITVLLSVLLVVLMIVTPGSGKLTGPENVAGTAVSGTQSFLGSLVNGVGQFFSSIFSPNKTETENQQLKEQIAALQQDVQTADELKSENERLKSLLNYVQNHTEYEYITARVITKDPGYYFDVFVINAGYNDGVSKDDTVITPDGLVGRVTETGGSWSKVVSIIDSRSSVSGNVERKRDNGVVNGIAQSDAQEGLCEMEFLPLEAELQPGDQVITNGLGGVFPRGFVIGQVVEVSAETGSTGKVVTIKPAVDFLHLEEVLIVKTKDVGATATAQTTPTPLMTPTPGSTAAPSPSVSPTPENQP